MDNCTFCKIINEKTDTVIEYENDELVVFKDIKPASDFHYLAVLKRHIDSAKCLKPEDEQLLTNMEISLKEVITSKGVSPEDALYGFHWPPFTSVKHIHMHGIAPASQMGFISSWIFKPNTLWFSTSDYVREWIKTQ